MLNVQEDLVVAVSIKTSTTSSQMQDVYWNTTSSPTTTHWSPPTLPPPSSMSQRTDNNNEQITNCDHHLLVMDPLSLTITTSSPESLNSSSSISHYSHPFPSSSAQSSSTTASEFLGDVTCSDFQQPIMMGSHSVIDCHEDIEVRVGSEIREGWELRRADEEIESRGCSEIYVADTGRYEKGEEFSGEQGNIGLGGRTEGLELIAEGEGITRARERLLYGVEVRGREWAASGSDKEERSAGGVEELERGERRGGSGGMEDVLNSSPQGTGKDFVESAIMNSLTSITQSQHHVIQSQHQASSGVHYHVNESYANFRSLENVMLYQPMTPLDDVIYDSCSGTEVILPSSTRNVNQHLAFSRIAADHVMDIGQSQQPFYDYNVSIESRSDTSYLHQSESAVPASEVTTLSIDFRAESATTDTDTAGHKFPIVLERQRLLASEMCNFPSDSFNNFQPEPMNNSHEYNFADCTDFEQQTFLSKLNNQFGDDLRSDAAHFPDFVVSDGTSYFPENYPNVIPSIETFANDRLHFEPDVFPNGLGFVNAGCYATDRGFADIYGFENQHLHPPLNSHSFCNHPEDAFNDENMFTNYITDNEDFSDNGFSENDFSQDDSGFDNHIQTNSSENIFTISDGFPETGSGIPVDRYSENFFADNNLFTANFPSDGMSAECGEVQGHLRATMIPLPLTTTSSMTPMTSRVVGCSVLSSSTSNMSPTSLSSSSNSSCAQFGRSGGYGRENTQRSPDPKGSCRPWTRHLGDGSSRLFDRNRFRDRHFPVKGGSMVSGGRHQRQAANVRERRRMKTINDAFEGLRARIPIQSVGGTELIFGGFVSPASSSSSSGSLGKSQAGAVEDEEEDAEKSEGSEAHSGGGGAGGVGGGGDRKLSKVDTLRMAIRYISYLAELVNATTQEDGGVDEESWASLGKSGVFGVKGRLGKGGESGAQRRQAANAKVLIRCPIASDSDHVVADDVVRPEGDPLPQLLGHSLSWQSGRDGTLGACCRLLPNGKFTAKVWMPDLPVSVDVDACAQNDDVENMDVLEQPLNRVDRQKQQQQQQASLNPPVMLCS